LLQTTRRNGVAQASGNYDPPSGAKNLGGIHLSAGRNWGIVITNLVVGNDTVVQLYVQDISGGETTTKLKFSHTQR